MKTIVHLPAWKKKTKRKKNKKIWTPCATPNEKRDDEE